jgi:hypothetical protein
MLTVYLVLLLAVPSNLTIGSLGSYGRPSLLFGLVLLAWWLLSRLQRQYGGRIGPRQPVRLAFGAFLVLVLVSFAAAMFRGQPLDQVSPAESAIVRLLSWGGVLLVTLDGVRTREEVGRLVRRLAIAGGLLAALGLLQFFTHQSFLGWYGDIPGLSYDTSTLIERGSFTRASGTARHPLEFAVAVTGTLPFALAAATNNGFVPRAPGRRGVIWWLPPTLIIVTSLVAVSRSAIIGLLVAAALSLTALPKRFHGAVVVTGVLAAGAVAVAVPGIFSTTLRLFTGASNDPSTQSRTEALSKLPDFLAPSPAVGIGFGTFLPRYYIFDDQWALLLVEVGILGVLAFAFIVAAALFSALRAASLSPKPQTVQLARTLVASVLCIAVLFVFFDGLSFPISGGLLFLIVGLCGSMLSVASADRIAGLEQPAPLRVLMLTVRIPAAQRSSSPS